MPVLRQKDPEKRTRGKNGGKRRMELDLSYLQPKERASFALRALYEAAGCRK